MVMNTLNDFYSRIEYLTEKGTLEELLDFLELQRAGGSGREDVFNMANTSFKAFEVLPDEAKVRFQVFSPREDKEEKVINLFVMLFKEHLELLKRLCELLSKEYTYLGSLTFEEQSINDSFPFLVKQGYGGYYITHNLKDF